MVVNRNHGKGDEKNTEDKDHAPGTQGICECGPAEDKESGADAPHRDGSSWDDLRIPVEGNSHVGVGPNGADQGCEKERGSRDCGNPRKYTHPLQYTDAVLWGLQSGLLWFLNLSSCSSVNTFIDTRDSACQRHGVRGRLTISIQHFRMGNLNDLDGARWRTRSNSRQV
jgi:hypothetical protein